MSPPLFVSAIIAAGGRGQRFGGARPKQLLEIGGRAILERSVAAFASHERIAQIVVALPGEIAAAPPAYLAGAGKPIVIVPGGGRRQDSVANGFAAVDARADVVVVHDAARPFVTAAVIDRTIDAANEAGASIAAVRASDTVKESEEGSPPLDAGARYVKATLPRETIFLAQTPQGFRREVLRAALELAVREGMDATDEAALAERAGHRVRIVDGDPANIKITTPADLPFAEAIAAGVSGGGPHDRRVDATSERTSDATASHHVDAVALRAARVGTGYDLHRLVDGRRLVIGGVAVPSDRGAIGHSDADVACHAAIDAILGAASLGDIGRHFPDSDAAWRGASSLDLLSRAAAMVASAGYAVDNVDVTIVLEAPKIRDHVDAMRRAVAKALGIEAMRVSIKGKTNEGADAVGRGEAIAAHAVALLTPISPR